MLAWSVAYVGFGRFQLRALRGHLRLNLLLVELGQLLPFFHNVVDVDVELLHDARGLALDFNLGDRLNLSRGNNGAGHVTTRDLGQLVGIEGGAAHKMGDATSGNNENHGRAEAEPDPEFPAPALCSHITPRKTTGDR